MTCSVVVLGARGRLGQAVAYAFIEAGWRVVAPVRRKVSTRWPVGVVWLQMSTEDTATLAAEVRAAHMVVHAVNPPYTRWAEEGPRLAQAAIDLARSLDSLLVFPGNVYNFGQQMPEILLEDTPQRPTTRKGEIRMRIEQMLHDAAQAGVRTVIVRAGDFFGGLGRGAWLDRVIAKPLLRARVVYPGRTDLMHAWAYLPDLAETIVQLAENRAALGGFETLHFPGYAVTGEQLIGALERSARALGLLDEGHTLQRHAMPWKMIRLGGAILPSLRELVEMRYLWDVPHRLSGDRLGALIGTVPITPFDEAVQATVHELFGRRGDLSV